MVIGLETFRAYFGQHNDHYALIGGAACDLLFTEAGLPFRATRDFDVILCVEVLDSEFATAFAAFLGAGRYAQRAMHEGEKKFYRFSKPETANFPAMIELFARPASAIDLPETDRYVRLDVEDALISLSALLLDEDYYALVKEGREIVDGISILGAPLLIPFKAKAWLDLTAREAAGTAIDRNNIKKHRNDVFRLVQLLTAQSVELPNRVNEDLRTFCERMRSEDVDPAAFRIKDMTKNEALAAIVRVYGL